MFHIRHTFVRKLPTQYSETLSVKSESIMHYDKKCDPLLFIKDGFQLL